MTGESIKKMLNDFLQNASPEEIRTLERLLEERKGRKKPFSINVDTMAKDMARSIEEQLGITTENIAKSAREIVTTMILQYRPFILKKDLETLVEMLVPSRKKRPKLPPDILMTMVTHFVCYSTGRMPDSEKKELPEGWTEKYWENFPETMQKLIGAFLREQITEKEFWETARAMAEK